MLIWLSKGHSPGKNEQAISRLLACQNSLSFYFSLASKLASSFIYKINLISVE